MSNIYYSKQGERLDLICQHYYGYQSGAVEQVLAVNAHLADLGVILPIGSKVSLPTIKQPSAKKTTVLW